MSAHETVVVAMSGGVDSSAAAMMLADKGYEVVGVAMQVWDYRQHGGNGKRATCCAPGDFDDARQVAQSRGFPFYVFDFEDSFEEKVINPFVESYLSGNTPNPCIECNRKVKFKELRRRAHALGASKVATGHYAQIKELADGKLGLFTSKDRRKDQTYFLFAMTQDELGKTIFPVGGMTKDQVRRYLGDRGQRVANKAESQDICFISGSVPAFIERKAKQLSRQLPESGQFLTRDGVALGEHKGVHHYTVGQRKGLGLAHAHPLYVLEIDSEAKRVVVGAEDELAQDSFWVSGVNWIGGMPPSEKFRALVKLRYRHPGVVCELEPVGRDQVCAKFLDRWSAVSPGQAAVFYSELPDAEGDYQVFGGGTLCRPLESSSSPK